MSWIQLELRVDREAAPLVEAALETGGALAVTIDDGDDEPDSVRADADDVLEPAPGSTPLWRQLRITALFDDDPNGTMLAETAADTLAPQCSSRPSIYRLDDRPWERLWLEGLTAQRFGRRLWVCPRGQRVNDAGAVIVDLDPGLAFGTGHHATTALCLGWLDSFPLSGCTVLDFGCGSGILAIAALKLGAAQAVAVDHDPQALEATLENATINGVAERISVCTPDDVPLEPADVVVANILAKPLIDLAPTLTRMTAPAGRLALSGILSRQADTVAAAYRAAFALEPPEHLDEWALVTGKRHRERG